ncbi:PIN domain-containing protein [Microbacterium sp. Bi121]|uniref:PIN domain-containing protein n=1 Tax=Microbacterium sp. Bi121 TaxID=2822348 RepID=UPI001DFD9882|nr:PIN domain-containing protein [Microbacterium sp. Bi121]CAH0218483.1 tRNA(fMet)-specific endonuclease VapC [Microbacterium sp. Bi121]
MILLDTSVLIDIDHVELPDDAIALSALSAAELHFGIERASTMDLRRRRIAHLSRLTRVLDIAWLPFDETAAIAYGQLAAIVARTRPAHARGTDLLLAGHALALGARLVTLNPKDFELLADEVEIIVPELRD